MRTTKKREESINHREIETIKETINQSTPINNPLTKTKMSTIETLKITTKENKIKNRDPPENPDTLKVIREVELESMRKEETETQETNREPNIEEITPKKKSKKKIPPPTT